MERMFTKDVGRFKTGEVRDYARNVWGSIATSARLPLERFTREVAEAARETVMGKADSKRSPRQAPEV